MAAHWLGSAARSGSPRLLCTCSVRAGGEEIFNRAEPLFATKQYTQAKALYLQAADPAGLGYRQAQFRLGQIFAFGFGNPVNHARLRSGGLLPVLAREAMQRRSSKWVTPTSPARASSRTPPKRSHSARWLGSVASASRRAFSFCWHPNSSAFYVSTSNTSVCIDVGHEKDVDMKRIYKRTCPSCAALPHPGCM